MTDLRRVIFVDLDGVLAEFTGWRGLDHFGDMISGADVFMHNLCVAAREEQIAVFVTRLEAEPTATTISCGEDFLREQVMSWLVGHGVQADGVWVGRGEGCLGILTRAGFKFEMFLPETCRKVIKNWRDMVGVQHLLKTEEVKNVVGPNGDQGRVQGEKQEDGAKKLQQETPVIGTGASADVGTVRERTRSVQETRRDNDKLGGGALGRR
jgi:hypothetical protein